MPFNMQPLIASSPMRQESPIGMNPIEIQSYQPPWKTLSEYAMRPDLDRLDTSAPHFQQLVNQVGQPKSLPYKLGLCLSSTASLPIPIFQRPPPRHYYNSAIFLLSSFFPLFFP